MMKINPCQPGFGASCALCCGSHNQRLSPEKLKCFYKKNEIIESPDPLLTDGTHCAYIGVVDDNTNLIGCTIYKQTNKTADISEFFNTVCSVFQCKAFEELENEEILFAAELCRDWFYYSILIVDIKELRRLITLFKKVSKITDEEKTKIFHYLENRLFRIINV